MKMSLSGSCAKSPIKALNREVEPYGFFLVNALREYHYALGRGLLTIASALFR